MQSDEQGVIDPDHDLERPDPQQLATAVGSLYEGFPQDEVRLYLASLVALDDEVWSGLVDLLGDRG